VAYLHIVTSILFRKNADFCANHFAGFIKNLNSENKAFSDFGPKNTREIVLSELRAYAGVSALIQILKNHGEYCAERLW
jgi:hypothetical protein